MMAANGLAAPPRAPVLGMSLSGGGYRAMINGLGMAMATMNGSSEAAASGVGGWMDAMSYMTGLSGGSWATGSFVANDGMLPTDLINQVWNLESNLIVPSSGKVSFYYDLVSEVGAKADEGFPTQITDYWGLALGDHLLPSQYHLDNSPNVTIDLLPNISSNFANAMLPFPIIIAAERETNTTVLATNATFWEFTPFEFGAWAVGFDNLTAGYFTPIEYLGTAFAAGSPNGTCYKGFDQMSFVMGTSSTLFNYALIELGNDTDSSVLVSAIDNILSGLSAANDDVSSVPNPFQGYTNGTDTNPLADLEYLTLFDAGEINQNLPLDPLLMPGRNVDAILAFDNSADTTYSWPNGTAMTVSYERGLAFQQQYNVDSIRMPPVPSINGFVNGGLNTRPVFFGCNETDTPVIIYVPNYPWSYYANSSTYKMAYDNDTAHAQMESSMRSLTLNGTVESWPKCLACAFTDRAFGYTSENRSSECAECFSTWCWDGTDNDTTPSGNYTPLAGVTPTFLVENNLSSSVQTSAISVASSSASGTTAVFSGNGLTIAAMVACALIGGVATLS